MHGRTLVVAVAAPTSGDTERTCPDPSPASPGAQRGVALGDPYAAALQGPLARATTSWVGPGGPSQPAALLTSLASGVGAGRTGIPTGYPFDLRTPPDPTWYARDLRTITFFDRVARRGGRALALNWPATAEGSIAWCLPLVEDLHRFKDRWTMAESTSSSHMVAGPLRRRREQGLQLSQLPVTTLLTEVAEEVLAEDPQVELAAVRLPSSAPAADPPRPGVGPAHRSVASRAAARSGPAPALTGAAALERLLTAARWDRILVVSGRPEVPVTQVVHPNRALADAGLLDLDGQRIRDARCVVWPDGPHGAVHVAAEASPAERMQALDVLAGVAERTGLHLRPVADGSGARGGTDVVAVLDGATGTLFGLSATARECVAGDDPYRSGPRTVADPMAPARVLSAGLGLAEGQLVPSWAALGQLLERAMTALIPTA